MEDMLHDAIEIIPNSSKEINENIEDKIKQYVHIYYWEQDINCARTMLLSLANLFHVDINQQTINAAIGLHGAGGYRAQCGLVEGGLMFLGVVGYNMGKTEAEIVSLCYSYADAFKKEFQSLQCFDLRPSGLNKNDPPHMCEQITCRAITFAYQFILSQQLFA